MLIEIYLISNKINNKSYVGITSRSIKQRWKEHRFNKKTIMSKAINKYGETNFTIKILDQTGDPKEALEIESKYIKKLKTLVPKGYNLVEYGSGNTPGLKRSDECKKRMSIDRLKDWQNPEYRKITSDAIKKTWDNPKRKAKQKIISKKLWEDPEYRKSTSKAIKKSWDDLERKKEHSKIMKKTSIENNWSEKRRKKMATLKNDPNWKRKQKKGVIKSFKTLDRLPQMKKISEKTWAKSPERKKILSNRMKKLWEDPEYKKIKTKELNENNFKLKKKVKINGIIYNSMTDASKKLNTSIANISASIKRRREGYQLVRRRTIFTNI